MRLEVVEDREFRRRDAVERGEIFERNLEEGELVALEILPSREAEHAASAAAHGVQHLDPEIV
jgi:hypothetical protein